MEPATPKQARELGANKYLSGNPCPRGHNGYRYTINSACVECTREKEAEEYSSNREKHWARSLWHNAKHRASKQGLPFTIELDDVKIPSKCPVLGLAITMGRGRPENSSPTIDRIVPSKGYVPGNIVVISYRANRLKSDATVAELQALSNFYERNGSD